MSEMRSKQYSQLEKDQLIKEVRDCGSISLVSKKHKVPLSTLHGWLKKKSSKTTSESPEAINKKLKKQLLDRELKIKILEDLLKKTNHAWLGE